MKVASILSSTNRLAIAGTAVVACWIATADAQIPCQYELVATIQGPNCQFTGPAGLIPQAISPNGLYVTGWYGQCDTGNEAFLWIGPPPGTRITIPRPPGTESARGYDVNDSAVVTGMCYQSNAMRGFVYKYQNGQWINLLPSQPNGEVQPSAINNASTVVGYRSIRNDVVPREAFIWNESTGFQGLGVMNGPNSGASDISENGIVVGWTGHDGHPFYNNVRGFINENGITTIFGPVPGGITSLAHSVNSSGHVIIEGKVQSSPLLYATYFYDKGAMSQVSPPTGFDAIGVAQVTETDLLVGACENAGDDTSHPCAWMSNQSVVIDQAISPRPQQILWTSVGAALDGSVVVYGTSPPPVNVYELAIILRPLPHIVGDTNCDEFVNIDDLVNVIVTWGPCAECPTDFDANGQVNIDDLVTVITHWSP